MKRFLILGFILVSCAKSENRATVTFKPMFSVWTGTTGTFDFTWGKIGYDSGVSGTYQGHNCVYNLKITGDQTSATMRYTNGTPSLNWSRF